LARAAASSFSLTAGEPSHGLRNPRPSFRLSRVAKESPAISAKSDNLCEEKSRLMLVKLELGHAKASAKPASAALAASPLSEIQFGASRSRSTRASGCSSRPRRRRRWRGPNGGSSTRRTPGSSRMIGSASRRGGRTLGRACRGCGEQWRARLAPSLRQAPSTSKGRRREAKPASGQERAARPIRLPTSVEACGGST
jgi:hypothetical protein